MIPGADGRPRQAGPRTLLVAIVVVAVVIVGAGVAYAVVAVRHSTRSSGPSATTAAPSLEPGTAPPSSAPGGAGGGAAPSSVATPSSAGPSSAGSSSVGSSSAGTAGATAAAQIAGDVNQSSTVRPEVSAAITQVDSCAMSPTQGEGVLNQAIAVRAQAVSGLNALDASGIPNGTQIVQDLDQALTTSSAADQAYEAWMVDFANEGSPCNADPTTDTNYSAGSAASAQASAAKQAFVAAWNPLAPTYQLPTYQATDF